MVTARRTRARGRADGTSGPDRRRRPKPNPLEVDPRQLELPFPDASGTMPPADVIEVPGAGSVTGYPRESEDQHDPMCPTTPWNTCARKSPYPIRHKKIGGGTTESTP
jgi:hypothetical protein